MTTNGGNEDSGPRAADIAIIGMAGRFPKAQNVDEYWRNIAEGRDCIARFTDAELDEAGIPAMVRASPDFVPARGVIEDALLFDAAFFGFTPAEAKLTDPQQRLFLECAWEALEHAGYDPERYPDPIGVYAGVDVSLYAISSIVSMWTHEAQALIGSDKDYLATRVSYKLNLRGPGVTVQTACSTSLVAVQLAYNALVSFQCDTALAGGVGVAFPQKTGYLYQKGGILSPDGHCRSFDARGKGTVGGDGCGVVVLKRLDDALRAGDTIHAVIRGAAINNDGSAKVGYTAPSVKGQAEVITHALAVAEVDPETITYVEAHGTATELGDPVEIAALTEAYRESTDKIGYCAVGSVKSNVGHMNSAAGIGGLIKTVMALAHRQIPPSLHFESPNPMIDFAGSPFFVNTTLRPWVSPGSPRRAGVSSFGVGGTNAHVVLEEAPPVPSRGARAQGPELLVVSAKTESALRAAIANLRDHLDRNPHLDLGDVAYTLQLGRQLFKHRTAVVCSSIAEATVALATPPAPVSREPRRAPVVFMFPGQGAQHVGMARELYTAHAVFREHVDTCAATLRPLLGLDLREILWPREPRAAEAEALLRGTALAQPALFVIEYALAQLWMSWGVKPEAMVGHSVGEYVAACLAGVFSLADALTLIAARGRLMERLPPGAMLAVPLSEEEAVRFPSVSIAALNGPGLTVLSGAPEAIAEVERDLRARGIEGKRLHTSHAFHSSMMDPILAEYRAVVARVRLSPPQIPYLGNLTGAWISPAEATDPSYWENHLRRPVRFGAAVAELLRDPDRILLEVGPGTALRASALRHGGDAAERVFSSLGNARDGMSATASILEAAGKLYISDVALDWHALHDGRAHRRVPLPTYPFERQRYTRELDTQAFGAMQAGSGAQPTKSVNVADWLHAPSWKRSAPLTAAGDTAGSWLVFADESSFGLALATAIAEAHTDVTIVRPGSEYRHTGPRQIEIDAASPDHHRDLVAHVLSEGGGSLHVVHLWGLAPGAPAAAGPAGFAEAQRLGFYSVLHLLQSLRHVGAADVSVITDGALPVLGTERLRPEAATVLALCQVASREMPRVHCRAVDVSLDGGDIESRLVERVIRELSASDTEPLVAYRGAHRWIRAFERVPQPLSPQAPLLREQGVYLILGGLGGVGLSLAEHLARTARAKLVLTSRTGLVAREEWSAWLRTHHDGDRVSRQIKRIVDMEALGAEVLVLSADVADEAQMAAVIERATARFGALHGVIHAAGVAGEAALSALDDTTSRAVETQFRAKAHGLYVLDRVLPRALDFCVLCSSLSTVLPGAGFAAYAAANHFLDVFAAARAGDARRFTSIDWDAFQAAGAPQEPRSLGAALASLAIVPEEAGAAFDAALALETSQVVVSTFDLEARRASLRRAHVTAEAHPREPIAQGQERPELDSEYIAPRTQLEADLAEIWQKLLGIDRIGVEDNFFKLGATPSLPFSSAPGCATPSASTSPSTISSRRPPSPRSPSKSRLCATPAPASAPPPSTR
ncbi:Malonyl CoA-acyl carrier protein transacylase [Minicystis rosea]|nr:Malonyl CoA-acyl carrier protein transacylase [Minicystis rosea]